MKQPLCIVVVALAVLTFGAQTATAQIETFMQVPGIPGDSTRVGHENWIDVFSVAQTFDENTRSSGACTVAVTKGLDRSGPPLWAAAVTGQSFTEIIIEIVKASATKGQRFYELRVIDARVTSISSSPSNLAEQLTISGSTAKLTYWPQNPDGSPASPVSETVDCGAVGPPVPIRKTAPARQKP